MSRSGSGRVDARTNTSTTASPRAVLRAGAAAQPAVPPGHHLAVQVDPRAGDRGRRVGVRPRPGQHPERHPGLAERGDGAERVVAVAVGPARHQHHRAGDPVVAVGAGPGAHRPVPPVGAVTVLAQPGQHPRLVRLDAPQPLLAPAVAPHRGHGRQHAHRRHVVAVVDEVDQPQRAAAPVHVVGPPVVAGVDPAHRLQRRRPLAGELEGVEAGVRRAPHAHPAVAPGLVGQPGDHLDEVALLGLGVLVRGVARRRAGAPQVDPAHGVPVLVAQRSVGLGVRRRQVVLAVGERLEQARLRALRRIGEVQRRGEARRRRRSVIATSCSVPATGPSRHRADHSGVEALAGVAVPPDLGGRAEHRVEHRLLGGSRRPPRRAGRAPRPDVEVGRSGRPSRSSRRPGGRGQEDLAAAVVGDRAGAGQAEPDPAGQPCAAAARRPGRR